ncbi:unnamed protein product, partial [Mesorhabditis spiculigera]
MRFLVVLFLLATVVWAFEDLVEDKKPQEGPGGAVTRKLKGAFNPGPCVYNSDCGFEGKCKKWRCVWNFCVCLGRKWTVIVVTGFIVVFCVLKSALPDARYNRSSDPQLVNYIRVSPAAKTLPRAGSLFCWAMTSTKYHDDRVIAVNQTWLPRCDHGQFFTNDVIDPKLNISYSTVFAGIPDCYTNLFFKTRYALRYIYCEISSNFDWYLKADDDTYVILENLRAYLAELDPSIPYYLGYRLRPFLLQIPGISRHYNRQESIFGTRLQRWGSGLYGNETLCPDDKDEDVGLARCFADIQIYPHDTRNERGQQRFNALRPNEMFKGTGLDALYWNYYGELEGFEAFGDDLISFHHLTPDEIRLIDVLLYRDGGFSEVFLGIPFAKPPIGTLRFEKPKPPESWEDVLDATKYGPACYPHNKTEIREPTSEDCLHLGVIRPKEAKTSEKLPVLVWIHPGGYSVSSASNYHYSGLANIYNPHGIIVVVQALQFIQETIEDFGGDKNKATIWGMSAGGASASQLALSPHAEDLFHRQIAMSGGALMNWAFGENVILHSEAMVFELGCSLNVPLKECLQELPVERFYDAVEVLGSSQYSMDLLKWHPRVDGDLFPAEPEILITKALKRPQLMGVAKKESLFFVILNEGKSMQTLEVDPSEFQNFDRDELEKRIKT